MSRNWKSILCWMCVSAFWLSAANAEDLKPFDTVAGWGTVIDPVGDCAFRLDQKILTISVAAGPHDLHPVTFTVDAPMVLQDVTGDFTVQVKVLDVSKAREGTSPGRTSVFHAGTLVIWQDSKNFVRFDRTDMFKDGRAFNTVYYHVFKDGQRVVHENRGIKDQPTRLRLQRRDGSITASFSQDDGKTWQSFPDQTVALPDKLKAGVAALNNSTQPVVARFANLKLVAE